MCHGAALSAFPVPAKAEPFSDAVSGFRFSAGGGRRLAILPDIYGCNSFYRGLATHLMARSVEVFLVNTFDGLGELPEVSRAAAFQRRHKVHDAKFIDAFEGWAGKTRIDAVVGFCLGGLYVFELARRGLRADLVGLYGFPQGMPNQDPLPAPFDHLSEIERPFTMVMGAEDEVVGLENVARLAAVADDVPTMRLVLLEGVGHNFLPGLDSDDPVKRAPARAALDEIERVA